MEDSVGVHRSDAGPARQQARRTSSALPLLPPAQLPRQAEGVRRQQQHVRQSTRTGAAPAAAGAAAGAAAAAQVAGSAAARRGRVRGTFQMRRPQPRVLLAAVLMLAASCCPAVHTVNVHVWTNVTDADFQYPEQDPASQFSIGSLLQKPSLGISMSGGGTGGQWRAAALAYGWLRALHLMNITDEAQYLSANSAATWAAVPYAYSTAPLSRFFSPYFEPHNLTVPRLSNASIGSWAQFASGKSLRALGSPVTVRGEPSSWARHLAATFLAPFGLGSSDASVGAHGTKGDILRQTRKRLQAAFPVHVACTANRPFPIITAAIMTSEKAVSPKFFPFEFTPLYAGMPPVARYNKPIVLGGGFAETLAFNSAAPRRHPVSKHGQETVDVTPAHPTPASSLVHAVGISSSEVALSKQPSNRWVGNMFGGETVSYWNLWDYARNDELFVDGAAVDDLAIMPLLRRGVKNIIACVATHADPAALTKEQFAIEEFALSGLFGALPLDAKTDKGAPLLVHGVDDPITWNDMQKVFPARGFDELYSAFKASSEAGKAHIFPAQYEVQPNSFMGVAGGYAVSVLWVLNGRSSQWEGALHEQTARWLAKQRGGSSETRGAAASPYRGYPSVQHISEAPAPLIGLLSQQASWSFRAKKGVVAEFVAAAAGSASGPGEEVIRGNAFA